MKFKELDGMGRFMLLVALVPLQGLAVIAASWCLKNDDIVTEELDYASNVAVISQTLWVVIIILSLLI